MKLVQVVKGFYLIFVFTVKGSSPDNVLARMNKGGSTSKANKDLVSIVNSSVSEWWKSNDQYVGMKYDSWNLM